MNRKINVWRYQYIKKKNIFQTVKITPSKNAKNRKFLKGLTQDFGQKI